MSAAGHVSPAGSPRSLPPGLSWAPAPAVSAAPAAEADARCFGLADVEFADFGKGRYEIMHYPAAAYGLAFGPLSVGQVLRFCQYLAQRLEKHGGAVFQYGPTSAERANCAVLLGAFLILIKGWSASAVAGVLRSEAKIGFICSWTHQGKAQAPVMHVRDCWDGLQLAGGQGWLRIGAWEATEPASLEVQLVDMAVSQYRRTWLQYDACWLVPAEVLVMADPMTTIRDPNPATCPSLEPGEGEDDALPVSPSSSVAEGAQGAHASAEQEEAAPVWCQLAAPAIPGASRSATKLSEPASEAHKTSKEATASGRGGQWDSAGTSTVGRCSRREPDECGSDGGLAPDLQGVNDEEEKNTSLHSVCKVYQAAADFGPVEAARPKALDFVSLLRKHDVSLVVRTNNSDEQGLSEIGGSYDPAALRQHGIVHLECFVKDVGGGIPPPRLILSFLQEADRVAPAKRGGAELPRGHAEAVPAVVIHCKSGFGRSVLFACLLVIHRYDVSGRALLGWARLVRPGAFTVPEQERFLCSFRGREDLHRHVGLVASAPCCSVQ